MLKFFFSNLQIETGCIIISAFCSGVRMPEASFELDVQVLLSLKNLLIPCLHADSYCRIHALVSSKKNKIAKKTLSYFYSLHVIILKTFCRTLSTCVLIVSLLLCEHLNTFLQSI